MEKVTKESITKWDGANASPELIAATFNLMRKEIEELQQRYDQLYDQVNDIDPGDE